MSRTHAYHRSKCVTVSCGPVHPRLLYATYIVMFIDYTRKPVNILNRENYVKEQLQMRLSQIIYSKNGRTDGRTEGI